MYKPRILWVGEASYLNTGYSVYCRELFSRLQQTGKYILAELGCYSSIEDQRISMLPWKIYPNLPYSKNQEEINRYNSKPTNQFGEWRFEDACLDFEPDIVVSITDPWMHEYQFISPYRRLYKHIVMPTVDSGPQQPEWIAMYNNADILFTYSKFGKETLEGQSTKIKVYDICRPGFDNENFKVYNNKEELRQEMLAPVPKNARIIGTVMRNQKRKLFDDLFVSLKMFCEKYPELGENTYLLCHTSFPDNGLNFPRILREHGLCNKVLFTYICAQCGKIQISFFNNIVKHCPFCNGPMRFPSTQKGATNEQLGKIYNCMDLYVQFSIAEGFGLPQAEAAACGTYLLSTDYSAMEDVVRLVQGIPIQIAKKFRESETHCYRVYPSNDHLVEELHNFFTKPQIDRHVISLKTKALANKYFDWDTVAQQWSTGIDSLNIQGSYWRSPPFIHQPNLNIPKNINNNDFVNVAIQNITGRSDLLDSFIATKMLRDLNAGMKIGGYGGNFAFGDLSVFASMPQYQEYTRDHVIKELLEINAKSNYFEEMRMEKANGRYQKQYWM